MQNPEITKPAGAGDVPEANYKMIAALGVKRGDYSIISSIEMLMMFSKNLTFTMEDLTQEKQFEKSSKFLQQLRNPENISKIIEKPIKEAKNEKVVHKDWEDFFNNQDVIPTELEEKYETE